MVCPHAFPESLPLDRSFYHYSGSSESPVSTSLPGLGIQLRALILLIKKKNHEKVHEKECRQKNNPASEKQATVC